MRWAAARGRDVAAVAVYLDGEALGEGKVFVVVVVFDGEELGDEKDAGRCG